MQTRLSDKERKRLGFINRQPSLSRHSAPVVLIEPTDDSEDETIHVSPSFLEPLNADLDGDTVALYIIHDREALLECEDKAFLQNSITYDQNNSFLATFRHEALYAAFVLTKEKFNKDNIIVKNLNSLKDLPESIKLWNDHLYDTVQMRSGELYSYGRCLFNKFCGFDKVIITKSLSKKLIDSVSEELYNYYNKDNKKYYDSLAALEKQLFFFISSTSHAPSLDVENMVNLKNDQINKIFKNLPNNNIKLGYYIVEALTNRALDNMDENSSLYKLYKSGSRFSKAQLARSAVAIGYSADADNVVIPRPIKTSLLEGLSEEQYFMVAPATRKSIKDKSRHTPNSGYLERTLVMALSMIEFDLDDCETNNHLEFIVMSNKHAQTLVGKYHRDPNSTDREWKVLDLKTAIGFINRKIEIRSPMTCQNPNFKICKKCFGEKELKTKYVGIVAGQCVVERLTQLTLRTFHESGRANLPTDVEILKFFEDHLVDVETDESGTTLIFDNDSFPEKLITNQNPLIYGLTQVSNNKLIFTQDKSSIKNQDVIAVVNTIKNILKQGDVFQPIEDYYSNLMAAILEVGTIYSSFIEILLANMFVVDYNNKLFWRYHQDQTPTYKLGDKGLAAYISSRIGLLYQPNKNTIENISLDELEEIDQKNLTIYEKIYLGQI